MTLDDPNRRDLTPNELKVLRCVLATRTNAEAAAMARCGISTVNRMRQRPVFARAYREECARRFEDAAASLRAGTVEAVECLRKVIAESGRDRVVASRCLLETAARISEMNVEERLDRLEQQIDRSSQRQPRLNASGLSATA